jgi:hypothetical protein
MHYKRGPLAAAGRWAFAIVVLLPLTVIRVALVPAMTNALRTILPRHGMDQLLRAQLIRLLPIAVTLGVFLAIAIGFVYAMRRWEHQVIKAASTLVLLLCPFLLVTFGQAIYRMTHPDPTAFAAKPLEKPRPAVAAQPRVLFVLFDEWDYRLTFDDRAADLTLPELDRLRGESLFARQARPPATSTFISIPSILTGHLVDESTPVDVSDLLLQLDGETRPTHLRELPNIFSLARNAGLNTGIVGWALPYCRMLPDPLTSCTWLTMDWHLSSTGVTYGENVFRQLRSLFEMSTFSLLGRSIVTERRTETLQTLTSDMLREAVNPDTGFLYVHLGVPHPPYSYNRRTGKFDLLYSPPADFELPGVSERRYLDNVALVDRTIGDLRRRLEGAGLWDSSVVLFTSDHFFRRAMKVDGKTDGRIPFILKMPAAKQGLEFTTPFNTLMTYQLLGDIFHGRVKTTSQAAEAITAYAEKQPVSMRGK